LIAALILTTPDGQYAIGVTSTGGGGNPITYLGGSVLACAPVAIIGKLPSGSARAPQVTRSNLRMTVKFVGFPPVKKHLLVQGPIN